MIEALWIATVAVLPGPHQEVYLKTQPPEDMRLSGRIVTVQGAPVAGASLSLRSLIPYESREVASGVSGSDGKFVLQVVQFEDDDNYLGRTYLWVEAPGFAPARIDRIPMPSPPLDLGDVFVFEPVELSGVVLDPQGQPIAGAQIHAALGRAGGAYEDDARRPPIATSDAQGAFTCRSLPPGIVTLGASAPGFADVVLDPLQLADGSNTVRFELAEGRTTELVVVDQDGRPVQGARVLPMGDVRRRWQWRETSTPLSFWHGALVPDAEGHVRFDGLAAARVPEVEVQARGYEAAWIELNDPLKKVVLRRATLLHITALRDSDGSPVAIHMVNVRDGRSPDFIGCGNCEDAFWFQFRTDSPAVRILDPSVWEIEWNGPYGRVRGGQPGEVSMMAEDGTRGHADLPVGRSAGQIVRQELRLDQPATLSGRVVDQRGAPVAVRMGVQIDFYRSYWWTTRSSASGEFRFDRIAGGFAWLYSMDDEWTIDEGTKEWNIGGGSGLSGIEVRVLPRLRAQRGRAEARLSIGGRPPAGPVLVALDDIGQDLPDAYPRSFTWSDAEGRIEIGAPWPREYHIVPKRRVGAEAGAWRDFLDEFPAHGKAWPWTVTVPESGVHEHAIAFPPESEWDKVAPPDD